ncbi:MAG: hypothetical protein N2971_07440 [Chlorobi bacterium]|nr:hypothetical protein [Chlorobiota bacterium]
MNSPPSQRHGYSNSSLLTGDPESVRREMARNYFEYENVRRADVTIH